MGKQVAIPFEVRDRLRSKHRLLMFKSIYQNPLHYADLIEITGLKPGSIYHHLKILGNLIVKSGHGVYEVTEFGETVIQEMNLVESNQRKPQIVSQDKLSISREDLSFSKTTENLISTIWLGYTNYILLFFTLGTSFLLSTQGLALAGSAIYPIDFPIVLFFNISAILLGWLTLFIFDKITNTEKIYDSGLFTFIIRSLSMFPGAIMGLSLFILFQIDVIPNENAYVTIFIISILFGNLLSTAGIMYLRTKDFVVAFQIASVISLIDLLFGFVVLVST